MPSEAQRYSPKRANSGTSCHAGPPEARKCWDELSCSSEVRTENRSSLDSADPTSLDSTDLTSLDSVDPTSLGSTCLDGPGEPRLTFQEVLGLKVRSSQRNWTSIRGNLGGGEKSPSILD
ncbi:hypothetical protein EHS25_010080 [Saitozyma podzolica]|uniref:Uncharacterized protein n=1 Tax=Saitozyma podzolica TaxID=1890683 RepID=A0A427YII3_9TREE|nr:hypothetical protein EHS25_010080 [Saitozyma podzolica]